MKPLLAACAALALTVTHRVAAPLVLKET